MNLKSAQAAYRGSTRQPRDRCWRCRVWSAGNPINHDVKQDARDLSVSVSDLPCPGAGSAYSFGVGNRRALTDGPSATDSTVKFEAGLDT